MTELPPGWTRATLGEIGHYLNGRGFKKSEWSESGRPIIRIQNLTGSGTRFNHYDGEADEDYIARDGDLLVSWAATLGVYIWRGREAVINQHIFKVRSLIDPAFHRYLLLNALDELQRQTHGSGMVHITRSRFESTPVALPPPGEQRRIVAAIDEHVSRLDAGIAGLLRAEARAESMRRSVLDSEFARIEAVRPLGELAETRLGKMLSAKSRTGVGARPYLRNKNVQWGRIDLDDLREMDFAANDIERFSLRIGDVLVCEGGDVGRSAIWRGGIEGCCFQKALHRVRVGDDLLPEYLAHVMRWFADRQAFDPFVTGSTIKHLPQEDLRIIPIPAPAVDEQRRIIVAIEQQLSAMDAPLQGIRITKMRASALRRAIQQRALRGELA